MESQDLDRIHFVTRHYGDLKGLQSLIPLGSLYLGMGLCSLLPQPANLIALIAIAPVLLAGEIAWMFYSNTYYRKRFGEAHPIRQRWGLAFSLFAVLILLPLGYLWYRGAPLGNRFGYVIFGSILLFHWLWKECRASQLYDLILGALLVGIAMPVSSPSGFLRPQLGNSDVMNVLTGGAWCLAGLLDHWQLVRTLGPRQEEEALVEELS